MRYTSRVFDAQRAVKAKLRATVFSPHPTTGQRPEVQLAALQPEYGFESISLRSRREPDDEIEWRRFNPPGADERLRFEILIRSFVPATLSDDAAMDRLETLADEVQAVFFDYETNRPIAMGFDGEVEVTRVVMVDPEVAPVPDLGWVGGCVVTVTFQAQI